MVDERIVERRRRVREQRRRGRLHRTIMVVVALFVAVALLLVERSPVVAISEVRVAGVSLLGADEVRAAAGIQPGTSLLRVRLGDAADRVTRLARVESAEVVRVDPLTIEIRVVERQPKYLAVQGEDAVTVDDDGVVLATGRTPGLVEVQVDEGPLPEPGMAVGRNPALANAVAVAEGLSGILDTRIAAHHAVAEDEAMLVLDDDTRVMVGRADQLQAKARALAVVLEDLAGRHVTQIDVRSPSSPVVTP